MSDSFRDPEFWDSRHRSGNVPWEVSTMPTLLARWIAAQPAGGAVLIPGCGSGREITAFANAGWNVTAIDFSPSAIARARANLGATPAKLIVDDFFTNPFASGAFDLIYERTFLTALSPMRWPTCVARYRDLLQPAGRVVGYCYYGYELDPPPFFQPPGQPPALTRAFDLEEDAASPDALPFFGERERWQVWRRREIAR